MLDNTCVRTDCVTSFLIEMTGITMKNLTFLTLAIASLAFVCGCSTKQETPKSAANVQQTADDGIFKYTITTEIDPRFDDGEADPDAAAESDTIEILVAMNSVGGQYSVNYDLDCDGDGTFEYKALTDNQKCIYKKNSGKHQIRVRGEIPAMFLCARRPPDILCEPADSEFNSELDTGYEPDIKCDAPVRTDHSTKAVVSIDSWGNVPWKSMKLFAADCKALESIPDVSPNLNQVKDISGMFLGASSFNQPIEKWDVSNVTNMSRMFSDAASFNQPLGAWNVSNVTNMNGMFSHAASFNQPLGAWNVSNVTNMSRMFAGAALFNQTLEMWNVSNVTNMRWMFSDADSYNQPLEAWNVSSVTNMGGMFSDAASFNQPLGAWNVSKVTDMSLMFHKAASFNQPLERWNVSNVTDMSLMFSDAASFDQPIEKWDVSSVTNMRRMFRGAASFNQPLEKWHVSQVCDMDDMFNGAEAFDYYPKSWVVHADHSKDMFIGTKVEEEARKSPLKTAR